MKITIELEIQPDEVALAAELLSTLRTLTDHVKVVTPGGAAAGAPAGPAAAPAANGGAPVARAAPSPSPPAPAAPAAPAPAPAPVAAPAPPAAPPGALAGAPQLPQGVPQPFTQIIPRLGNPATQEQAMADVVATLRGAGDHLDKAVEDLIGAFEQQVFDSPEVIGSPAGVMPYMALYQRLPEDLRPKIRDKMVAKVLTALTRKRPASADRTSFFAYADAFATLVKFEAVPMEGAVATLGRLLMKLDTRCAGVTMLGKTVEYCGEQLLRAPENILATLWRSLEAVKEEAFAYDLQYVFQTLHNLVPNGAPLPGMPGVPTGPATAPAASAAAAAAASAPASTGAAAAPHVTIPSSMAHVGVYSGHNAVVFTLSYDAAHQQLASGSQDGQLILWGADGQPASRMDFSSHFVCSLDFMPRSGTLLAAGVPSDAAEGASPEASCIAAFSPPAGRPRGAPWTPRGRLTGLSRGLISFVRALGGDGDMFAIGENSSASTPGGRDVVALYDASRGGPMEQLTPLQVYGEHKDMVTCGTPWYANPAVFVSGGRDAAVRVWDRRMANSVGEFGALDSASGRVMAHADMITCLDTVDTLLISTSVDSHVCIWDFRQLSMTHGSTAGPVVKLQIDQQPTLKVAVTGAPHSRLAAISTYQGLYVMDFTNMTQPHTILAPPLPDGRPYQYYHDIRWAGGPGGPGQPLLFGASSDPRIDLFGLAF